MLRKLIAAFTMTFALSFFAHAQDDELDRLGFEDGGTLDESGEPYFAVGVGYLPSFFFVDLEALNDAVAGSDFSTEELGSPIYVNAFHVTTAIGIVPNLRIGFMLSSGATEISQSIEGGMERAVDYYARFNGLSFEYALVPVKSFAVLPGVVAGWGRTQIETRQTSGESNWSDFPNPSDPNDFLNLYEAKMWFVEPGLSVEYAVAPFTNVRASGGYALSFMHDRTLNRAADLKGAPDELNASGAKVQLGLYLGIFNY